MTAPMSEATVSNRPIQEHWEYWFEKGLKAVAAVALIGAATVLGRYYGSQIEFSRDVLISTSEQLPELDGTEDMRAAGGMFGGSIATLAVLAYHSLGQRQQDEQ